MAAFEEKGRLETEKAHAEGRKTEKEEIDENEEEEEEESQRTRRDTRKKQGVQLNGAQGSITVAFAIVLAGIVAKRNWFSRFLTWIRA